MFAHFHLIISAVWARAPRPWHLGILHAHDTRLAQPLIARLQQEPDLCVEGNVPYSGHLPGDSIERHALAMGLPNVLIEIRNDLIVDEAGQSRWAAMVAEALVAANAKGNIDGR